MRILLAHNSLYYPSHGGGDKSNRLLMAALAARGNHVRVVARIEKFGPEAHERLLADLAGRGIHPDVVEGVARFHLDGVDVHTLTTNPRIRAYFAAQIDSFDPDIILSSTDDPAQLLLEVALGARRARVVYLVRALIALPFGPDSSSVHPKRTEVLRQVDGAVGVSEYVARYVREHGGFPAIHVPISLMERKSFSELGRFENPYVTLVNPCAVKGISIFLGLAERMPQTRFAAVPTWGTSPADMAAMRALPNVTVLAPVDDIDKILELTRVMLVPSIWAEARSRMVMEAMLRAIPVVAADVGGLPEAKLGVPYLLPVNPIRRYKAAVDENMVPVAEVPQQDLAPWETALRRLTTDRDHWLEIAAHSRRAALEYLSVLTAEPLEEYLTRLLRSPKKDREAPPTHKLSPEKQRLLALALKRKAVAVSAWFPLAVDPHQCRLQLFCFPHAGGGTLWYRSWKGELGSSVSISPALFPGRESRLAATPVDGMGALIQVLTAEIERWISGPFAFFGHSMGAAIAFELARSLRRRGLPPPLGLFVSGARAPQFRLHHIPGPEPDEQSFLEELRALDGLPAEVLENPEALRLILPALRADARLYRRYVYEPEPPLPLPVFAYGGAADPNVRPEHLEKWREQTTSRFERHEFPGGHFYLQTHRAAFLAALARDLAAITPE